MSCRDPGNVPRGFIAKLDETGATLQQFGKEQKGHIILMKIIIENNNNRNVT